jgi:hypothetical protein
MIMQSCHTLLIIKSCSFANLVCSGLLTNIMLHTSSTTGLADQKGLSIKHVVQNSKPNGLVKKYY